MDNNKLYLTKEGLNKLKLELKELMDLKRPEIAKRIQTAREMGDISENAEYDLARQEQAFIEGRVVELEDIIKSAVVADTAAGTVGVGSQVTVHVEGDEEIFVIVGGPEADPINKKISHESPLGKALIGKKVGDKIEVDAPIGVITYTVLHVN